MVNNAATLGRSGVHDFIIIRVAGINLALYAIFLLGFFLCNDVTYNVWKDLFSSLGMQVFTIITLLSLLAHIWIGLWQVLTDYVKPVGLRFVLQLALNAAAFSYVVAGLVILWRV